MVRTFVAVSLTFMCISAGIAAAGQVAQPVTQAPTPTATAPSTVDEALVAKFIDRGVQRGITYDALRRFEDLLNIKLKTGHLRVHVVFLPTSRDRLQASLLEGRGDIVAANVTQTVEREALADFVAPTYSSSPTSMPA